MIKMRMLAKKCFEGEVTMEKTKLWMIGAICLLTGIVYGLRKAPLTHGVCIGSNNGNDCGNHINWDKKQNESEVSDNKEEEK